MPVYEYQCSECGERFELLVRSAARQGAAVCPRCGSSKAGRAISLFGMGKAGGVAAAGGDACGPGPT